MKENSKKSLLLLYRIRSKDKLLGEAAKVSAVLADLQPGGRRAMIAWWQRQGWIESISLGGTRYLSLTTLGRTTLEQELPYFQIPADWQGEWQILVLREAPPHDKAFHSLRQIVKRAGAMVISRGVYGFINRVPRRITQLCQSRYRANVVIMIVKSEGQSAINELALSVFHIYDQINAYSGISKEIDSLLASKEAEKGLINKHKNRYHSLYSRFFAVFCEDNGLMNQVMPGAPHPLILLTQLQALILA